MTDAINKLEENLIFYNKGFEHFVKIGDKLQQVLNVLKYNYMLINQKVCKYKINYLVEIKGKLYSSNTKSKNCIGYAPYNNEKLQLPFDIDHKKDLAFPEMLGEPFILTMDDYLKFERDYISNITKTEFIKVININWLSLETSVKNIIDIINNNSESVTVFKIYCEALGIEPFDLVTNSELITEQNSIFLTAEV